MKKDVPAWLVRLTPDGKRERVGLPDLVSPSASDACHPQKLVVRPTDDLWIRADCKGTPAVFRRAR